MAMDIKQVNSAATARINSSNTGKGAATQSAPAAPVQTAVAQKADSVSITPQAQQLQNVQTKMADMPDIDQKKVDEIKAAIAEGRYKIDPEKLATNIANFENELSD
ncbi:flagellar biosynthesis anti-sigma factor FlgM [Shewanella abyssi]|uniref:flagellar biosynthesis anti-sigma factor FlgM n=1 Tax=Shewanella abyssi TaxID=311789 RepID=UPI00200DD159|nr:flagellar biosynthesis anti-sigma factor FlgM [Shewanella abyssi]MCL1050726.1 flagellar biosynthesis anti-sigma factor FlgM [Shewanella abyssi]